MFFGGTRGIELLTWLTYGPGDDDVVLVLRQPKLQTVFLHSFRFQVRRDASIYWHTEILQSSRILSKHFFFGLPLDRCPCVWPWSSIFGNLSLPILFTCPLLHHDVRAEQFCCRRTSHLGQVSDLCSQHLTLSDLIPSKTEDKILLPRSLSSSPGVLVTVFGYKNARTSS